MNEQLSPHFTLTELTNSEIALRKGIDNSPSEAIVANLTRVCAEMLEPIRNVLGVPLHINSGYRCREVNTAVGGAVNSAHIDGRAADFVPVGIGLRDAFDKIRASGLQFD